MQDVLYIIVYTYNSNVKWACRQLSSILYVNWQGSVPVPAVFCQSSILGTLLLLEGHWHWNVITFGEWLSKQVERNATLQNWTRGRLLEAGDLPQMQMTSCCPFCDMKRRNTTVDNTSVCTVRHRCFICETELKLVDSQGDCHNLPVPHDK